MLRPKYILKPQHLPYWRRHPDLNWGIKVLQTSALPLGYGAVQKILLNTFRGCYAPKCKWSGRRDSNSRRSPWQGDALPLSHSRIWCFRVESNHRHRDFQSLALPTELQKHMTFTGAKVIMAIRMRFELTTSSVTG